MNRPDKWIVVKITTSNSKPMYKVFGTFFGGYLDGDSWKLNSGVSQIKEDEDTISFYGYSGSVYECGKKSYGTSTYTQGILDSFINKAKSQNVDIEILDSDTDWLNLL